MKQKFYEFLHTALDLLCVLAVFYILIDKFPAETINMLHSLFFETPANENFIIALIYFTGILVWGFIISKLIVFVIILFWLFLKAMQLLFLCHKIKKEIKDLFKRK